VRAPTAALVAVAGLAIGVGARAEEPEGVPASDLARAKALFRSGLALLDAADFERALDQFERSRTLVPGAGNTVNVAICLDRLGRYDESLEAYEDALSRYADQLAPEERAAIAPAIKALRARIGSLEIATNVDGAVVVDARARGQLPRATSLRLLAGAHVVRVLKDGYETCEKRWRSRPGPPPRSTACSRRSRRRASCVSRTRRTSMPPSSSTARSWAPRPGRAR
jgi:hypothetical protein